jgi:nicotinamidase-related amidase
MDGKPALLILHMQQGFAKHNYELWKKSGIIVKQQVLLKAFRSKNLPVVYVNVMVNPPVAGKIPAYGLIWAECSGITNDPKDLEVIADLSPQLGEPVLLNWPPGVFNNSGLEPALKICGAQTLVATGFSTNGVINNAMQGAADRYYSTIIPKDAIISPSAKAHDAFINEFAPLLSLVTTTEDVIAHL